MPVHPYRPPPLKEHSMQAGVSLLAKLPASLTGKALGSCYRVIDAGAVRFSGRLFLGQER